jgi:hypothetical protein
VRGFNVQDWIVRIVIVRTLIFEPEFLYSDAIANRG